MRGREHWRNLSLGFTHKRIMCYLKEHMLESHGFPCQPHPLIILSSWHYLTFSLPPLSLSVKEINNRNNFKGVVRLQWDAEWTAFSLVYSIQESASLSLNFTEGSVFERKVTVWWAHFYAPNMGQLFHFLLENFVCGWILWEGRCHGKDSWKPVEH